MARRMATRPTTRQAPEEDEERRRGYREQADRSPPRPTSKPGRAGEKFGDIKKTEYGFEKKEREPTEPPAPPPPAPPPPRRTEPEPEPEEPEIEPEIEEPVVEEPVEPEGPEIEEPVEPTVEEEPYDPGQPEDVDTSPADEYYGFLREKARGQMEDPSRYSADVVQQGSKVIEDAINRMRGRGKQDIEEHYASRGLTGSQGAGMEAEGMRDFEMELQRLNQERQFGLQREQAMTYGQDVQSAFGQGLGAGGLTEAGMGREQEDAYRRWMGGEQVGLGREELGLRGELGRGELGLREELGRGELGLRGELGRGELELGRDRFGLSEQEFGLREELGRGQLGLGEQQLSAQERSNKMQTLFQYASQFPEVMEQLGPDFWKQMAGQEGLPGEQRGQTQDSDYQGGGQAQDYGFQGGVSQQEGQMLPGGTPVTDPAMIEEAERRRRERMEGGGDYGFGEF